MKQGRELFNNPEMGALYDLVLAAYITPPSDKEFTAIAKSMNFGTLKMVANETLSAPLLRTMKTEWSIGGDVGSQEFSLNRGRDKQRRICGHAMYHTQFDQLSDSEKLRILFISSDMKLDKDFIKDKVAAISESAILNQMTITYHSAIRDMVFFKRLNDFDKHTVFIKHGKKYASEEAYEDPEEVQRVHSSFEEMMGTQISSTYIKAMLQQDTAKYLALCEQGNGFNDFTQMTQIYGCHKLMEYSELAQDRITVASGEALKPLDYVAYFIETTLAAPRTYARHQDLINDLKTAYAKQVTRPQRRSKHDFNDLSL